MSDETRIYLELDEELQQAMLQNDLSVDRILREAGLDARIEYAAPPVDDAGETSKTRDPATVIVAGAVLVYAIGAAIAKVLNTINQRRVIVWQDEMEELREDGKVLVDKKTGKPFFKRKKTPVMFLPEQSDKETAAATLGKYLSMKFTSEHRQ